MNIQKHLLATTAAATALIGMVSVPAQASTFSSSSIKFDTDTIVDFTFLESHGYYRSAFGIQEVGGAKTSLLTEVQNADKTDGTKDWMGTCGISVTTCNASFTFKANTEYKMTLDWLTAGGEVRSLNYGAKLLNPTDTASALNDPLYAGSLTQKYQNYNASPTSKLALASSSASIDPFAGPILIALEDFGLDGQSLQHVDYNDFMVKASARAATASVPEPTTLAGLSLIAGVFGLSRRGNRKTNEA